MGELNWIRLAMFLMFLSLIGTFTVTWQTINISWRDEAVKKGHAEYYLDLKNNKQWRWLNRCDGKNPWKG